MMNLIDIPVITFTEDYLVSCCIDRLRPEELLMDFIAQVSYDALMNGSEQEHERDASYIVEGYDECISKPFDSPQEHWVVYRQCAKALKRIQDDSLQTTEERKLRMHIHVKVQAAIIKKRIQFVDKVLLADGQEITLTPDFIVVCFMLGIPAKGLLDHFIEGIRIIKAIAAAQGEKVKYNPGYHFYTTTADAFFKDRIELYQVGHYKYLEKMKKLNETLKSEPDYGKRLAKLNALTNKWCKALKDVPIDKMFRG